MLKTYFLKHKSSRTLCGRTLATQWRYSTPTDEDATRYVISSIDQALAGLQENLSRVANGVTDLTDHETRALQKMESMQVLSSHTLQ